MESMNFINPRVHVAHERSEDVTKGLRVYKIRRFHGVCVHVQLFYTLNKMDSRIICYFDRQP